MFDKVIEFSAHKDYYSLKEDFPSPIKFNLPEWYKNLKHSVEKKTIKGCMPFLDSITSGYLLRMPQDMHIRHNIKNPEGEDDCFHSGAMSKISGIVNFMQLNLNTLPDAHPIYQLFGSPLLEKNKNLPFHKIYNPWTIKTPKGYSCLFVPPLNNTDDRFSIIPGIVDTDNFPIEINFPIVINGDKYPVLETIIKRGTPYVQIIPFKRDSWKMKVSPLEEEKLKKNKIYYFRDIFNAYKNIFWNKKSWK
jgi:hypothetical protein